MYKKRYIHRVTVRGLTYEGLSRNADTRTCECGNKFVQVACEKKMDFDRKQCPFCLPYRCSSYHHVLSDDEVVAESMKIAQKNGFVPNVRIMLSSRDNLLDHEFSKAVWGKDWQKKYMEMAMSEDIIKYLRRNALKHD